ncbi:MAG TPA: aa3-type cytochrome c oxidase subunit IV [Caulobacteraceae bacterium]
MADHAHDANDYHRGEMDIHEQVSTYALVMNLTKWGSLVTAALLIWLVLWFCTNAGFLAGLITGIVVFAIGVLVLRERHGGH